MLLDIIKIAKTMKRPIIHVTPNYILGTDNDFCNLSIIEISLDNIPRIFTAYVNSIVPIDKSDKINYNRMELLDDIYIDIWIEPDIQTQILLLFKKISEVLLSNPKLLINNMDLLSEEYINFRQKSTMKVSDGHSWIYLPSNQNSIIMSIYSQLYQLNASDKAFCTIYDLDYRSVLAKVDIIKKKYTISNYIRYRKL